MGHEALVCRCKSRTRISEEECGTMKGTKRGGGVRFVREGGMRRTDLLRVKREYALSSFSATISWAGLDSLRMIWTVSGGGEHLRSRLGTGGKRSWSWSWS